MSYKDWNMIQNKGTPATLFKAIENGIEQAVHEKHYDSMVGTIEAAVIDYLRQQFTIAYILAENSGHSSIAELRSLAIKLGVEKVSEVKELKTPTP